MKLRLLSFVAVAAMSLTAMAQTWTAPVAPESPAKGVDYEADGATAYYLYNVGAGQFVLGANTWATQISLSSDSKPYMEIVVEPLDGTDAENYPDCVMLKLNGTFYFSGDHDRNNYEVSNTYLFRDSEASGFIDHNNQAVWFWKFTKAESGNYYWQSAPGMGDNKFPNSETQYAKGTPGAGVEFNATADAANIEWAFVPVGSVSEEDMAAFASQMELYNARLDLYDLLNDAALYGVDYAAASTVYNNAAATAAEVTAAAEALRPDVNAAAIPYGIAHSSEDAPFELTKYALVNADFEAAANNYTNPTGWTVTPGMGQNLGQQNASYTNNDVDPAVSINKFIEAWYPTATGALHDGVICQQVTGLPAGRYRIAADVMAVWQGAALEEDPRGIYLYYDNGSFSIHGESLATENGKPLHFEFDFDYDGTAPSMEIGLMAQNTNQNWMGMDNFKLFAIGPMKDLPSFTALVGAVNTAKEIDTDTQKAEYNLITDFESAIDAAEELVNAGSDESKEQEYKDAFQVLDKARSALTESQAAYKKFRAFIDQLNADERRYNGDLKTFVADLAGEYESKYDEGSITTAEIDAAIEAYPSAVRQFVQQLFDAAVAQGGTLDEPLDITPLIDHMDFPDTNGGDQEAFANGYPADAPVWMNETSTGNFKTNYGTAEVWDARPFNIYRDFTDLPKGNYTIKTHAFFRVEANDANYPNWQADSEYGKGFATLYAGVNHTPIPNLAQLASPILADLDAPYDCLDGNYLPNNQHSANMIFTDAKYANLAGMCYIGASGNVLEDGGTLRAGIQGTSDLQGNHWTIWYGFELYYNGIANLDEDIQSLMTQLDELYAAGVAENVTKKDQALKDGNAALGEDFDTQTAAIKKLQEAIDAINKTQALIQKLNVAQAEYAQMQSDLLDLTPTDATLDRILAEIDAAMNADEFESNEQIEGWINGLPAAWAKYVLSAEEMSGATVDAPVDVTPALINADFEAAGHARGVMPSGWTLDGTIGANQGFQDNNTYSSEDGTITLSNFLECWRSGNAALTDGTISQTIAAALPQGYYRLSVDGYATNQGNEEVVDGVFVFVNGAGASNNISIGAATAAPATWSFDFSANGSGLTTVGIFTQSTTANWFAVDNFRLEYLGTVAPDAVESLNADATGPAVIYGIDGRQQSQLRRGINIVRKGGNVEKILVK